LINKKICPKAVVAAIGHIFAQYFWTNTAWDASIMTLLQ